MNMKNSLAHSAKGLGGAVRRAAMMLLMMMLTTLTAWANDYTATYQAKFTYMGGLYDISLVRSGNSSQSATISSSNSVWPKGQSVCVNDEYDITFTPSSNLSIAVTPNTTNATGFIMSSGTSLTASMANDGGYYIKQVRLLNYSIPTATGTATALNSSSVTVTASDNIQFNYIEVTITSDYYGTITPKNGLTIGTAPTLTENGTNYYASGTTITMNAPASHIIEATSGVNSQSNPSIAADKRSYTFMMLKQNVSPGATTKEVHTISCPSGLTVTSNPYFTYNSTKYYKKDETYTATEVLQLACSCVRCHDDHRIAEVNQSSVSIRHTSFV